MSSNERGSMHWLFDKVDRLKASLAAAEARAERAETDLAKVIEAWPTISQDGKESGGTILYGPFGGSWYQHTIGGNWPTPNSGGRSTREAAVRVAAGLTEGGEK